MSKLDDIKFASEEKFQIDYKRVNVDGNYYFTPKYALHRPAVRNLLSGQLYEPKTHSFVKYFCDLNHGSIIHAGTFFGDMLPNFSKAVSGFVYAFEPVFENYILAKLCVDANELKNVILMNTALSDNLGNLRINTNEIGGKHAGGASQVSDDGSICTSISIDLLNLNDVILIQLDVEGHELIALRGAKETIERCRPVVAIEYNNYNCADFLKALRYENIGMIPGLTIWAPLEKRKPKQEIVSFLSG